MSGFKMACKRKGLFRILGLDAVGIALVYALDEPIGLTKEAQCRGGLVAENVEVVVFALLAQDADFPGLARDVHLAHDVAHRLLQGGFFRCRGVACP